MRADLHLGPGCRAVRCERRFRRRGSRRVPDRPHGTAFFLPAAADWDSGTASAGSSDGIYTAKPERTAEFHRSGEKDSALKLRTALLKFGVLPENAVVLSPKLAVEFAPRALPPEKAAEIRRVLEKYAAVPPEKVK